MANMRENAQCRARTRQRARCKLPAKRWYCHTHRFYLLKRIGRLVLVAAGPAGLLIGTAAWVQSCRTATPEEVAEAERLRQPTAVLRPANEPAPPFLPAEIDREEGVRVCTETGTSCSAYTFPGVG